MKDKQITICLTNKKTKKMKIESSILVSEIEKKEGRFVIYKAHQSPGSISGYEEIQESEKIAYFTNLEDATEYALNNTIAGYHPVVDIVSLDNDILSELDPDSSIDLVERNSFNEYELDEDYIDYIDGEYWGDLEKGKSLEGAIIVEWHWNRYVGYCRDIENIFIATNLFECDLKNRDETNKTCSGVLFYREEIENLTISEIYDKVGEKLNKNLWKWKSEKAVKMMMNTFFEFYSKVL